MASESSTSTAIPPLADVGAHRCALVILNPAAGQGSPEAIRDLLAKAFAVAGWRYDIHETARGEDLRSVITEAITNGCELVVAAGGDGTVGLTASCLVGTSVPLGILPAGTGNILSRELGIPLDLSEALSTIVGEHRHVAVDALRIGDKHYFLNAGIGLPAAVMRDTSRESKHRLGILAYAGTAIQKLARNRTTRFRVVVDGKSRNIRAAFVMVVNAGSILMPEFRWVRDAAVDDGTLDVVVARAHNLRDYLLLAWHLWTGKPIGGLVRHYRASRQVTISARRSVAVQADGDFIDLPFLDVRVVPHAIRVVVPLATGRDEQLSGPLEARNATRLQLAIGRFLGPVRFVDTSVYVAVGRLPHPEVADLAMRGLSASMSKGMAWAVGLFVASRIDGKRGRRALLEVLPTMWLAGLAVEFPVKRLFSRARPFAGMPLTAVIGSRPGGYSFPSAHTAVSFAVAWLLRPHYPHLAPAAFGLATLVGFSRLYLGVHYVSDVLVGAATGTLLAEGLRRALRLGSRR